MLLFSSCTSTPLEFRYGFYRYTVENKEVTITEYSGIATDVTVPESIRGMPVVAIDTNAFCNCITMKSLTIPDSVIEIGGLAFFDCHSLEKITLGRGIREIGFSPFSNCDNITYNEYENGNYVGTADNPYFALVSVSSEKIESFTLHPDTVIVCGSAIQGCYLLRELVFPEGVISIGDFAVQYCSSLEKVSIPKSVEWIGLDILGACDSLREIVVSEENAYFKSEDGNLFSRDGTRLIKYAVAQKGTSYHIPNGTVVIESYAFKEAKHLTEVVFSDSVEEIGHWAFLSCENLQSIHFGNALKKIDGQAFGYCASLTEIIIPDSVEELSYSVFSNCTKLESAVIGSGVVRMDSEVFSNCDALSNITFRDSEGWEVEKAYSITSKKIDVSNSRKNADYLTDEYCQYYWHKK